MVPVQVAHTVALVAVAQLVMVLAKQAVASVLGSSSAGQLHV